MAWRYSLTECTDAVADIIQHFRELLDFSAHTPEEVDYALDQARQHMEVCLGDREFEDDVQKFPILPANIADVVLWGMNRLTKELGSMPIVLIPEKAEPLTNVTG